MEMGKFFVFKEPEERGRLLEEAKGTLESVKKYIDDDDLVVFTIQGLKE
jgi:hypothetical protein